MINNTIAFHFIPAIKNKEDTFEKKLRCFQDSKIINTIMEDSLKENNPIKFGMLLHVFADTFSHQGFSGLLSKTNDVKDVKTFLEKEDVANFKKEGSWFEKTLFELKNNDFSSKRMKIFGKIVNMVIVFCFKSFDGFLDRIMPAYGHGQVLTYPDIPYFKWGYEYDYTDDFSQNFKSSGEINNQERFKDCFIRIKEYLEDFLKRYPEHKDDQVNFTEFDSLYEILFSKGPLEEREKEWQRQLIALGLFDENSMDVLYDENRWMEEAFENYNEKKFSERKIEDVKLKNDFIKTRWYKYYLSVKWYKKIFFETCEKEGLLIQK